MVPAGPPPYVPRMATLHIEHRITDLATWTAAFASFAGARHQAGVLAESVRHVEGDECEIMIDLDFPTAEAARAFLAFLEAHVWSTPANSPALVGSPVARILEPVVI